MGEIIKQKQNNKWKVIAIVFIILFVAETSFLGYSVLVYNKEVEKTNICFYDVCEDYPNAEYEYDLCTCYDYDVLGSLVIVKQEYMK